jgi:DNA-binding transcriptional ArsR family regulator
MRQTATRRAAAPGKIDVYEAIADPTRRRLIDLLREREMPVNRLAEEFRVSRPAISQHLGVLRRADLVRERRVGRERHYRLHAEKLREVAIWLRRYERFWSTRMRKLGEHLDREE